eukprot:2791511-Pleurochrysis_carterae.AAC.1
MSAISHAEKEGQAFKQGKDHIPPCIENGHGSPTVKRQECLRWSDVHQKDHTRSRPGLDVSRLRMHCNAPHKRCPRASRHTVCSDTHLQGAPVQKA